MSETTIRRFGSSLKINENRFEYYGSNTSAYMDFDCRGARDIIDFFSRTKEIDCEKIKCFNFSSNIVKDMMEGVYGYNDINITMRELREKYNIESNYVFCDDISNLIFLLKKCLYNENKKEIVNMVSKIKQITRGKVNEG